MTDAATIRRRIVETDPSALRAEKPRALLVNVGLRCDLACSHCHLECSPERTEIMSVGMMGQVVTFAARLAPDLIDVTGGSPELHPDMGWFAEALVAMGLRVRMRTNLTALSESAPELAPVLADLGVGLLASVPIPGDTRDPRGPGLWEQCAGSLEWLSDIGFGTPEGPPLDLACASRSSNAPGDADVLDALFREALGKRGVSFGEIVLITCVPVGRFADGLGGEGVSEYVAGLEAEFEPETLAQLGCRHGIEVAWDGTLWDCDFNLAAGCEPPPGYRTIAEVDPDRLTGRPIAFGPHCFACTAAAGSS